jgi:hypothetical protein
MKISLKRNHLTTHTHDSDDGLINSDSSIAPLDVLAFAGLSGKACLCPVPPRSCLQVISRREQKGSAGAQLLCLILLC